ncbi:hypothetical protein [Cerasicoccus arenae]|uniref:Uncharacterized protein n=1 Tax=Cerasicoccus arenae TaxID=424488 RepID=A0A8J3DAZ4_9BACT|nr:hypothetical protein [Cerasicoccus arenae]MBK1859525.1 hypothetical protein [Cerasicoccus arenae]GHB97136.1 hypothetical protein GCM10007047_11420 [Cerasicoccus arenae]
MNSTTAHAILGVRLCALFIGVLGLWLLVANLVEGFGDFNPSYIAYFLVNQVARPLIAVVLGLLLWAFSGPLGRLLGRGLS